VKKLFVSDCEGPVSKNDNAYELAAKFVPNGERLFCNISRYDDVLADVFNKPGYTAGGTLKLILPFLKAYNVTDSQMEDFSSENIVLIENTQSTLNHIKSMAECFIVSTSYEHYIKALCRAIDFPYKNTYCTKVSLDSVTLTVQERTVLCEMAQEISQMPLIVIPDDAKCLTDFSLEHQAVIKRLDEIFWGKILPMSVGKFLSEVVAVGGEQKAESIRDIVKCLKVPLKDVMYVGDSITDVEALRLVKEQGGLAVSFNGNSYAVKSADVAVVSESNLVTAVIAEVFCRLGREETLKVLESWSEPVLETAGVDLELLGQVFGLKVSPKVQIVTSENMNLIVTESSEFRKRVRGVAIGRLG
jgi:energy-converting hydrogenase A subunit R